MGLLLPPLLPLLLFEEAGFYPHREGNGFPMHGWRFIFVSTLFESCEPYSGYSTAGCEDSQHRLSKFSSFSAQQWTAVHNPRFAKIHIRRSGIFNDGTCTGRWFWIYSRNFSLLTTVNTLSMIVHKKKNCPYSCFIALRDALVLYDVADVHQCNKVDFPYLLFMCLLYDHLSFLFLCRLCIWNQHCFGWKIFYSLFSVSGGMRLWETDLQSLLNHTQLSIPEVRWSEPHSEFVLLSSQVLTWEYLVLTRFWGLLEDSFVSQIRCAARRDCMCLLSTWKGIKWWASSGACHRNEFLRKVVIEYRIPSIPCNIKKIEFVFVSDVLAFLQSSTRIVNLFLEEFRSIIYILETRNDSSLGTQVELSVQHGDNEWSILE